MTDIDEIIAFWFEEAGRPKWFVKDASFDETLRARFEDGYREARRGAYQSWRATGRGCVALCILLDQFPRNMYRDRPEAFATDAQALAIVRHALDRGLDLEDDMSAEFRQFLYMPLMHSEHLPDQRLCVELFRARVADAEAIDFAERHLRIIERFGRFPHRNAVLGRNSTPEELAFLETKGSHF